jgi:hypothetical protein
MEIGSLSVLSALIGAVAAGITNWLLEGRKFKREQRLAYMKDRLDLLYSPLLLYFDNMKSWAQMLNLPDEYAFFRSGMTWPPQIPLEEMLEKMYQKMEVGMRMASQDVIDLWLKWQPLAVMHGSPMVNYTELHRLSSQLHGQLKTDYNTIRDDYLREVGEGKDCGNAR